MRVAIVPTSSPLKDPDDLGRIVAVVESLGFEAAPSERVLGRLGHLAGPAEDRAADLHAAYADPSVDALLALRGGYGAAELLPLLDVDLIHAARKPLVGMSDVTMLHLALSQRRGGGGMWGPTGMQLLHGTDYTRERFRRALAEPPAPGPLDLPAGLEVRTLVPGAGEGPLGGGTTTLLAASLGTPWEVDTAGRVVIIEDLGGEPYEVDRTLVQLLQAGKLADAAAIAIGEHVGVAAAAGSPSLELAEVFERLIVPLGVPTAFGLPLGHTEDLATVPYGEPVRLDASGGSLELLANSSVAR